jgi:hypothetical protein
MEQIMYWLVGGLGVPLVNGLKVAFGVQGKAAVWLTAVVAAVLAVIAIWLSQSASGATMNPEQLFAAFGQVLAAATLAYKLLAKE